MALFSEAIREGRRFVDVAREVRRTKPIVVLKAGKRAAGAAAATSHTGSLAGRHGAAQAAFARAGVVEAPTSDAFFDALVAVSGSSAPRRSRVAILTISGGPGVLAADAIEDARLELPPPAPGTVERLQSLAAPFAALGNPIDLTPQTPAESLRPAIDAVFDDPSFDGVIVINCGLDVSQFGEGVASAAGRTGKPVAAFLLDVPKIEAALAAAGIPRFPSPERAVSGYAIACRR